VADVEIGSARLEFVRFIGAHVPPSQQLGSKAGTCEETTYEVRRLILCGKAFTLMKLMHKFVRSASHA
jgi:hypothetical protein